MNRILIGTDPELFVIDEYGRYVSGHDLIPGTKDMPHHVPRGAIQVDGVACEFNIDPAETKDEFTKSIRSVMNSMTEIIQEKKPAYDLDIIPTAHFDKVYFDALPEEIKVLGCTPDFNAYTGKENEPPFTNETFRTGAGHIHIGWGDGHSITDERHISNCRELVQQLDVTLYPSSLLWDDDTKRRTLYGKMGSFRPKPYGVEYRPLSNAYLRDKSTQEFVFEMTVHVTNLLFDTGTRIYSDDLCAGFVKSVQGGKSSSRTGIRKYLEHIGKNYGTPVFAG
jgi:hypothetical protein